MPGLLINVDVDDLEEGVAFYTAAFGLDVGRRLGAGAVELVGGPVPLYLLEKPEGSAAAPGKGERRAYGRHWTPVHLDFVVDELDEALARALAAGATQEGAVRQAAWGRLALCADPFGHGFCLLEFQGRGYDELV